MGFGCIEYSIHDLCICLQSTYMFRPSTLTFCCIFENIKCELRILLVCQKFKLVAENLNQHFVEFSIAKNRIQSNSRNTSANIFIYKLVEMLARVQFYSIQFNTMHAMNICSSNTL